MLTIVFRPPTHYNPRFKGWGGGFFQRFNPKPINNEPSCTFVFEVDSDYDLGTVFRTSWEYHAPEIFNHFPQSTEVKNKAKYSFSQFFKRDSKSSIRNDRKSRIKR